MTFGIVLTAVALFAMVFWCLHETRRVDRILGQSHVERSDTTIASSHPNAKPGWTVEASKNGNLDDDEAPSRPTDDERRER